MAINNFGVCPTGCNETLDLPVLDVDQNCTDYDTYESQLTDLWIKPRTASETPFSGYGSGIISATMPVANPQAIDNANTDNTKVKWLVGKGGVPVAEKAVRELPKFRDKTTKRTYTLTYTVDNLSDAQYNFGVALQCGGTDFTFWYGTTNHVFGPEEGLSPKSVDVDFPHGEGRQDIDTMIITLVFEAKTDPPRRNNPYS